MTISCSFSHTPSYTHTHVDRFTRCPGPPRICTHQSSNPTPSSTLTSLPCTLHSQVRPCSQQMEALQAAKLAGGRVWQGAGRAPGGLRLRLAGYRARGAAFPQRSLSQLPTHLDMTSWKKKRVSFIIMHACSVTQSCPTLCNPRDYTVH